MFTKLSDPNNTSTDSLIYKTILLILIDIILCFGQYEAISSKTLIITALGIGLVIGLIFMFKLDLNYFKKIDVKQNVKDYAVLKKNKILMSIISGILMIIFFVKYGFIDHIWFGALAGLCVIGATALIIIAIKRIYYAISNKM